MGRDGNSLGVRLADQFNRGQRLAVADQIDDVEDQGDGEEDARKVSSGSQHTAVDTHKLMTEKARAV